MVAMRFAALPLDDCQQPEDGEVESFLASIGQIHLVSILPDAPKGYWPAGKHFGASIDAAIAWAAERNDAGENVYWTVNAVRPGLHKKPAKTDIAAARFAHVDIDPPKDGSPWDREAALRELDCLTSPPSFVIDSGGGLQAFWRLNDQCTDLDAVEAVNLGIRYMLKADACHNIDRLMRLPGFTNWPDAKKRGRGREPAIAHIAEPDCGLIYGLDELEAAFLTAPTFEVEPMEQVAPAPKVDAQPTPEQENRRWLTPDDLGLGEFDPVRSAIEHPPGRDRSGDLLAAARLMANAGYDDETIMAVLLHRANAVSAHAYEQRDPRRAVLRAIDLVRGGDSTQPRNADPLPSKAAVLPFEWAGSAEPILDGLWLIDDWLPKSGIAAIYGHPGSGKSFLALDMAAHVASGELWAGRHVERGLVLYVVAEGQSGFRNRLYAMHQAGKIAENAPFVFVPCPIDMQAANGDINSLIETIAQVVGMAGVPVAMIVIDTLSKTFGSGKENTDDMAGYIANCQRVSSRFDCLTVVVHHRPKDSESRDLRGHSSLRGGIEAAILVEAGHIKTATTIKQKDGEDNQIIRFKLEPITIGQDSRGKEITTCLTEIVDGEAADAPIAHPIDRAKSRLKGNNRIALSAIEAVIAKAGVEPPADIPADAINRFRTWKAVDQAAVQDRLRSEFLSLGNGEEDKKQDTAKRTANRALMALKSAKILGSWGDMIWLN